MDLSFLFAVSLGPPFPWRVDLVCWLGGTRRVGWRLVLWVVLRGVGFGGVLWGGAGGGGVGSVREWVGIGHRNLGWPEKWGKRALRRGFAFFAPFSFRLKPGTKKNGNPSAPRNSPPFYRPLCTGGCSARAKCGSAGLLALRSK